MPKNQQKNEVFNKSKRQHVLMITNHGCHSPKIKVTIDTAGQNFYVNDYSRALLKLGYKVTILNRGGYAHPVSKEKQQGIKYYNKVWGEELGKYCRVVYLEDSWKKFIAKEEIKEKNLQQELDFLFDLAEKIKLDFEKIKYINSHYWDGGILGLKLNEELQKKHNLHIPHVWTPHSLGILKQENYNNEPKEIIEKLKFPKRIAYEEQIIKESEAVVANAKIVEQYLEKYQNRPKEILWFPPGVDTELYYPRELNQCMDAITLLANIKNIDIEVMKKIIEEKTVFFEISRTQESKRKKVILKAFTQIKSKDKAILIMALNKGSEVYENLMKIYNKNKEKNNLILIDSFIERNQGAQLYALSDVFATASHVESWGMTSHEAAASKCTVISSKYVPSVTEVLKEHAIIIEQEDPKKYAQAMEKLIENRELREEMAFNAFELVANHYSWKALGENFLKDLAKKNII
ncbi:MAG: glycosyltransferase [Candidatus Moranbacteria bacterium]|nr:glycosyltransferase [Candidatus Moranbacteria bacterium]